MTLLPIQDFVPHRRPLLLPDAIAQVSERSCRTLLRVDPDAWYADAEGGMPAWLGLELMAQTAAAHSGWQHRDDPAPRGGVLLGTRRYQASQPSFAAGTELEILATLDAAGVFGQSTFDCRILIDERPVAEATLRVLETA